MPAPSTCDLCDAHKTEASGDLRVLAPVYQAFGALRAFAGTVSTVQCLDDNTSVKQAVESAGLGRVLVVDGGGSLRRALVGGNLAAAAARNGWAGLLVNGCVRDRAELDAIAIGIRALALMPLPTERQQAGRVDQPVCLQGIWIRPGDWLVADEDGIVVMSRRPAA